MNISCMELSGNFYNTFLRRNVSIISVLRMYYYCESYIVLIDRIIVTFEDESTLNFI